MRIWRRHLTILGLAGGVVLTACGGNDSTSPVAVASVEVSPTPDTLRAGTTDQLAAVAKDAGGAVLTGRATTWSSADTMIARVNATGLVTGVRNGTVNITATVEGVSGTASVRVWAGVTGAWTGSVDAGGGGNICPMTQNITEAIDGSITGNGTLAAPCSAGAYTIVGNNNVGAVADSTVSDWAGTFMLTLSGKFNGTNMMTGEITGGGCNPGQCPYTFTRSSIQPSAPSPAVASGTAGSGAGSGPLGAARP